MSDSRMEAELREVDPSTVTRMAEELAAAETSPAAIQLFTSHGRPAPQMRWSPTTDALPVEGMRFLLEYWHAARGAAAMPGVDAIDPLALKPVLGNVIILDVLENGADFRFRLFGTQVAEAARFDWTGSTVDQMRRTLKGPGPAFYLAGYRALLRRREPFFTLSLAMVVFKDRLWARLILPHGDAAAGRVDRILVGNYMVGDAYVSDQDERKLAALREQMRAQRQQS